MIMSGFSCSIFLDVSVSENKFVSLRVDEITLETKLDFDNILDKLEPTNPLDPKIKILIFFPFLIPQYILNKFIF